MTDNKPTEDVPDNAPAWTETPPTDTPAGVPAGAPTTDAGRPVTDDGGRVEIGTAEQLPERAENTTPVGEVSVEQVAEAERAEAEQATTEAQPE